MGISKEIITHGAEDGTPHYPDGSKVAIHGFPISIMLFHMMAYQYEER